MPLKQHEADKLIDVIRTLIGPELDRPHQKHNADQKAEIERIRKAGEAATPEVNLAQHTLEGTGSAGDTVQKFDDPKLEALYQAIKGRLLEELPVDPVMLHLLTVRPEIIVDVERRTVQLEATELKGRIAQLIAAGFLAEPRRPNHIANELERTGTKPAGNRLSEALDWLKRNGFIVRDGDNVIAAPGVKITERTLEA